MGRGAPSQVPARSQVPGPRRPQPESLQWRIRASACHGFGPSATCWLDIAPHQAGLVNFQGPSLGPGRMGPFPPTKVARPTAFPLGFWGSALHPKPIHRAQVKSLHCPPFPRMPAPQSQKPSAHKS